MRKTGLASLISVSFLCSLLSLAHGQSTMEFQSGTTIEVQSGADICADNVIISGSYTGTGTQCGGALPVELVSMTAQVARSSVTLSWTTATETGNYGFEVERRKILSLHSATQNWSTVGFVRGSGVTTSTMQYSFNDEHVVPGRYAYRLKQIDNSGMFTYAAAIEVEIGLAPHVFTLSEPYPNPFNPSTTLEFTLQEDGPATLRVYNSLGQIVATVFDGEMLAGRIQQVTFDASALPTGAYFAKLESKARQIVRKMLLMK